MENYDIEGFLKDVQRGDLVEVTVSGPDSGVTGITPHTNVTVPLYFERVIQDGSLFDPYVLSFRKRRVNGGLDRGGYESLINGYRITSLAKADNSSR